MTGWRTRFLHAANSAADGGDAKEALEALDNLIGETTHMRKRERDYWQQKADEVRARVTRATAQ